MGLLPTVSATRGRVLVVDDEDAIRRSAEALLDDEFDVRTADCVREALAILDAEPIDVVVTDFHMGDGTGERVTTRATGRHVFTILVTGWLEDPRVVALGRSNLVLVLGKPVAPDALVDRVRHGLALARLAAAARRGRPGR